MPYNNEIAHGVEDMFRQELARLGNPDPKDERLGEGYRAGRASAFLTVLHWLDPTAAHDALDDYRRTVEREEAKHA